MGGIAANVHPFYTLESLCEVYYNIPMKQMFTAKLKLHMTPEQFKALRSTQLAYRDALNYVSKYAFEHGKTSNQQRLQRETYVDIRATYALPAQLACNVPRQVGATYKALWTKTRQNKVVSLLPTPATPNTLPSSNMGQVSALRNCGMTSPASNSTCWWHFR
jgi:predicted transposase